MEKLKVLFVCIHNSARSQMAEALLKQIGGEKFIAESSGLEPGVINPLAIDVLKEIGIDISKKETQSVFDLFKTGKVFNFVITVCDESSSERCPIFPGIVTRYHWSFKDPASFEGTYEEKIEQTRKVREEIKMKIEDFVNNPKIDFKIH